MANEPTPSVERPLSGAAKGLLVLSATTTILLCYLFSAVTIVFLLLLLASEFVIMLVLLRFGLAGFMANVMRRHAPLLGILGRSLWLRTGTEYRIEIQRTDAPRLFAMLDSLAARLQIAPPDEVSIEMNAGAWVRTHGFRRGAGRTVLGIGFDLLAGLSEREVEAVMAHEMAHAKLIQRGLKTWLNRGLARMGRATAELAGLVQAYRRAEKEFTLAEKLVRVSDAMTARAARLVARYSRQDEFEADRGAAGLCGAGPLRTSLQLLETMGTKLARLPWSERVAQLEVQTSFSRWLVDELSPSRAEISSTAGETTHDPYSTHPTLRDRLAALPPDDGESDISAPGIGLIAEPDRLAEKLMAEIQRTVVAQEEKDARSLAKWTRKTQRKASLGVVRLLGAVLVIAAIGVLVVSIADGTFLGPLLFMWVGLLGAGLLLWKLGDYRDKRRLPVPRFTDIKLAWQAPPIADMNARETEIEKELNARLATAQENRRALSFLLDESYVALSRCDYLRAHVATRLALGRNNRSIEAALGRAVAAAGLQLGAQVGPMLEFLQKQTGIATPSTIWGAAWALMLCGEWDRAEALLWRKHESDPNDPTFLALLAFAQLRRGKIQSAIVHAKQAAALAPAEIEIAKLHANALLDAGRLRDAATQLDSLAEAARNDPELALLIVRLRLLRRENDLAREWAEALRAMNRGNSWVIRLGEAFEEARLDDHAELFFGEVTAEAFFPQAHLGLARIAARRKQNDGARRHLLAALDMEKTVGEDSPGPIPLFQGILNQLMMLEEQRATCRAWIATFPQGSPPATPAALKACSVLIFATGREAAERSLDAILVAMHPSTPPAKAATLRWRDAPQDQQPARPVWPGVQCVL